MKIENEYTITETLTSDQLDQLYDLYQLQWWSVGRTKEEISTMLKHSISFALIDNKKQLLIGYARVLTDEFRYAFIFDVIVKDNLRGMGLGKNLMEAILSHPKLTRVKYFELTCMPDMVKFYKKFGFSENYGNVVAMRRG